MTGLCVARESTVMTVNDVVSQVNLIQQVMKEVMKDGTHYMLIPGCKRKSLLKPGAEKLSFTFRLRPIIDNISDVKVEKLEGDHINVTVYCHIMNTDGVELATGVGSASTKESKYRYRGGEKIGTGKPVPTQYWNLKNAKKFSEASELIGGDEYEAGKINKVWQICKMGAKVENPDIADTWNTVLKMAAKRAYVSGILASTAASDIFTQDIDDADDVENMNIKSDDRPKESSKPATRAPQPVTQPAVETAQCKTEIVKVAKQKNGQTVIYKLTDKEGVVYTTDQEGFVTLCGTAKNAALQILLTYKVDAAKTIENMEILEPNFDLDIDTEKTTIGGVAGGQTGA